nr:hypothetical protein [Tanacetum cinerariifolium]
LERKKKSRTSGLKRLWKIGSTARVESSEDKESLGDHEDSSKQERMIDNINQDKKISLVNETHGRMNEEETSKHERIIDNINQDKEISLVDETHSRMNEEEMLRVNDLDGDEVIMDVTAGENVEQSTKVTEKGINNVDPVTTAGEIVTTAENVKVTTSATTPQISKNKLTLVQTLIEIKAAKPKVNTIVDMNTEIVEERLKKTQPEVTKGSSKRAGEEVESEKSKKQKLDEHVETEVDNDQREAEIEMYMKIIPDDEIEINAIPLATKPLIIFDWKIIKEGKISSYHLIRADGSSKRYSTMIQML